MYDQLRAGRDRQSTPLRPLRRPLAPAAHLAARPQLAVCPHAAAATLRAVLPCACVAFQDPTQYYESERRGGKARAPFGRSCAARETAALAAASVAGRSGCAASPLPLILSSHEPPTASTAGSAR